MNLLATYKYQLADHKKSIATFYIVIAGIFILLGGTFTIYNNASGAQMGSASYETATIVFLFIVGLCTFKETFLLMIQNGVSRKTIFIGKLATMVTVALFMSFVDKAIALFMGLFPSFFGKVTTFYQQLYFPETTNLSISMHIQGIFFEFFLALAVMAFGYFITIMFYRLNRTGKVIVGAGVPITLFMMLPIIDNRLFGGAIGKAFLKLMSFIFQAPANIVCSALAAFILFSALSYLLMRRAIIKE